MNKATRDTLQAAARLILGITALLSFVSAFAEDKDCIELTTVAEAPQQYVNEQGQAATRLVPVTRAVPGDEVVWTLTAKNVCATSIEHVVVANPVPEHMSYVANSAMGIGAAITYSLDGREFASLSELAAHMPDGSHVVTADAVRQIRWTYTTAFAPGATAFVRYRATLN
ncbi:MAG: hypothetical protein ACJ8MR_00850 [Povalibacter sp.]